MILSTTAKEPEKWQRELARKLANVIPNSKYLPRGEKTIERMVELARKYGLTRVVVVNKKPEELKSIRVSGAKWSWIPKAINIKDIKIENIKPQFLKCEDEFLREFFDIESEDSDYELIYDNKIQLKEVD